VEIVRPARPRGRFFPARRGQGGFALMMMILLLVVGIAWAIVTGVKASTLNLARDRQTAQALALAKEALIGRAASDANHPGSLPCPDTNDDGSAELFVGVNCPSYIGRLPWKTLGLPDLRDGNGERLWYALSANFKDYTNVINSDTLGTLTVFAPDGATRLTQPGFRAVAVVFSAGPPLSGQNRDGVSAACAATGTTIARNLCADNYLEASNGRNNATQSGPYIAGAISDTFNDRLLFLTTRELIPRVEQRVARELMQALNRFKTHFTHYPWADLNNGLLPYAGGSSDSDANWGLNRGKLPLTMDSYDATQTAYWNNTATGLPSWFEDNYWYDVIFYAVGRDYTDNAFSCSGCSSNNLCIDGASLPTCTGGVNNVQVLFFMPGPPQPCATSGATPFTPSPCPTSPPTFTSDAAPRPSINWKAYLADAANHDNNVTGIAMGDDLYVTPSSTAMDRNRIYYRDQSGNWHNN
jgi:hypothetical protein